MAAFQLWTTQLLTAILRACSGDRACRRPPRCASVLLHASVHGTPRGHNFHVLNDVFNEQACVEPDWWSMVTFGR